MAGTQQQLCWSCQQAVPAKRTGRGCEWSVKAQPVPGWIAEPIQKPAIGLTWLVRACPKYEPDSPKVRRCD